MVLLRQLSSSWKVLLGLVFIAAPLRAQAAFEIAPLFGYYRPIGSFAPASVYSTTLPGHPSDLSGVAWGAEAELWLKHRIGVEVDAAVANSTIAAQFTPGGETGPAAAQVAVAAVEVQYDLSPNPEKYHAWVGVGPGVVRHGGEAYAENGLGSPISVGAAVGAGFDIPLTSHLTTIVALQSLLYELDIKLPPDLRLNPGSYESGPQNDLLLHVGLALKW